MSAAVPLRIADVVAIEAAGDWWEARCVTRSGDTVYRQAMPPRPWPGVSWMPCAHRSLLWRLFHRG